MEEEKVAYTDEEIKWILKFLPEPEIKIENVVSSVTVDVHLDLYNLARMLVNVDYDPQQFPGLIYRIDDPKTATLIFSSGKMVCTGAKSKEEAKRAVYTIIEHLREIGIKVDSEPIIKTQNIVASADIRLGIDLDKTWHKLLRVLYEPEQCLSGTPKVPRTHTSHERSPGGVATFQ